MGEWAQRSTHSTCAPHGCGWSNSCSVRFNPLKRASSTHWIEGLVGLGDGVSDLQKRQISLPSREFEQGSSVVRAAAHALRLTTPSISAANFKLTWKSQTQTAQFVISQVPRGTQLQQISTYQRPTFCTQWQEIHQIKIFSFCQCFQNCVLHNRWYYEVKMRLLQRRHIKIYKMTAQALLLLLLL